MLLPSLEGLFDGVNAGRCVTCKLDICAKFDGLWCQPASDRGGEDGKSRGWDGLREGRDHGFWFTARPLVIVKGSWEMMRTLVQA